MKKKTKREQLKESVTAIARGSGSIKEKLEQYQNLKRTQTILKRPPKDFKNDTWLFYSLGFAVIDDCLSQPAENMPQFFSQYQLAIDMELQRFRDEYNTVTMQTKGEWECYTISRSRQRAIEKRYAELHPDLVEANALLLSIAVLKAAGITNPALEKRCDEVTHHYDIKIIANLPVVEKLLERRCGKP